MTVSTSSTPGATASAHPGAAALASAEGPASSIASIGRPITRTLTRGLLWWGILVFIACGWDRAAWLAVNASGEPVLAGVERAAEFAALGSGLRNAVRGDLQAVIDVVVGLAYGSIYLFGRIWVWIVLAAGLIFARWASTDTARVRRGLREGVFVFLTPALAGLAAEALKILSGRLRPEAQDGFYAFRWSLDPSGKGLASSHASVAIAAALAAGLVLPRWRWVLWPLAIGCVLGRVLVGAHYVSDVLVGSLLGVLAYRIVYAWDARNNAGSPIDAGRCSESAPAP